MRERPMTPAQIGAWLALAAARGLPSSALRALLSAFGDVQALVGQPYRILADAVGDAVARYIAAASQADVREPLARTLAWCEQPGNALVPLDDPAYPAALLTMHDPPALLYVTGRLESLHAPSIAIVGSRNATAQGIDDAAHFARHLAAAGLSIVSGLALGIDAAAHRGALRSGGVTIAVVGTGADLVYPAKHRALAQDIAVQGAVVSEWPLGTPAKPAHFPQRNRLIAGMTRGVLVVEAALRSGSLITARLANEMGRDVFALPGSIHAPLSRGCHQLIKDGAKLTETPADILEEFNAAWPGGAQPVMATGGASLYAPSPRPSPSQTRPVAVRSSACAQLTSSQPPPSPPSPPLPPLPLFDASPAPSRAARPLSGPAARVLDVLGHAPAALEILAGRTDMNSSALQSALLELELGGHIAALPGGRYVRHTRAAPDER